MKRQNGRSSRPRSNADSFLRPQPAVRLDLRTLGFWEDSTRYLYLSRLKDRDVLAQAIIKGAGSRDFFGTAYGQHEGRFDGFKLGDANVQLDETLLLIEPDAAQQYEAARMASVPVPGPGATPYATKSGSSHLATRKTPQPFALAETLGAPKARSYVGTAEVNAATAKMRLVQIAEEIISVLVSDPQATVTVTVEIAAEFPNGAPDHVKRAVSENTTSLGGFKNNSWE